MRQITDFLAQVTNLQQQAVSPGPLVRLKERIVLALPWSILTLTYLRRRQNRMSALLLKAVLIFGLTFGSAGGTAALAAANSLPDSPPLARGVRLLMIMPLIDPILMITPPSPRSIICLATT